MISRGTLIAENITFLDCLIETDIINGYYNLENYCSNQPSYKTCVFYHYRCFTHVPNPISSTSRFHLNRFREIK